MKIVNYVLVFIAVTAIGMLYDRYSKKFYPDEELDKYSLVRKYLLNESDSVMGKPFLWIHTKHKINARNWESFYSRNSKKLNQPYKELCVESIVKHCGDSFQICLIDDSSFGKILDDWTICMDGLADPIKDRVRTLALSKILYTYGGMLVPNSTLAMKDLKGLHDGKLQEKDMFTGELVNRGDSSTYSRFSPSHTFMGCKKNSNSMKDLEEYLEILISRDNTDESNFDESINRKIYELMNKGKCAIICGKALGTKNKKDEVLLIDNWLEESPVDLCMCSLHCIVIPGDEILSRTKYQWFARLSKKQVLTANTQISKYMIISHGI